MKHAIVWVLLMVPSLLWSQTQSCNCAATFEEVTTRVTESYLGLAHMQGTAAANTFKRRTGRFRKRSRQISPENCALFLQEYLDFFEDGHLFVFELPQYTEAELDRFTQAVRDGVPTPDQLRAALGAFPDDPLVGLWRDQYSTLAVVKADQGYDVYVVNSSQPSVQGIERKGSFVLTERGLQGTYYSYQHAPRAVRGGLYKANTQLVWMGGMVWAKQTETTRDGEAGAWPDPAMPTVTQLDAETALLTIPSFLVDGQAFNEVLLANLGLFFSAKRLIIDIRGNTGGNALYFSFLEAYADRPLPPSQGEVLASEATLEYYASRAGQSPIYDSVARRIQSHLGEIVPGPAYPGRLYSQPETQIEQVAILMDRGCMSAAESFVLHSLATSSMVTTFGEPTAGVIDYTSVVSLPIHAGGNRGMVLGMPTSSLHSQIPQQGYNTTGILPQVPLSEIDPIQGILKYWDRQP